MLWKLLEFRIHIKGRIPRGGSAKFAYKFCQHSHRDFRMVILQSARTNMCYSFMLQKLYEFRIDIKSRIMGGAKAKIADN